MKKHLLFISLVSLCFLAPVESSARKKRYFKKKWSLSLTNGYTFYQVKKPSSEGPMVWGNLEGQMHKFFSALELSRNMGYYEIGVKIQNLGPTFASPFVTWNMVKNNYRASIVPALTFGIVPSHIMGGWLRLSLGLKLNRYVSLAPFVGMYAWRKIIDDPKYEKNSLHVNTGLKINMYY